MKCPTCRCEQFYVKDPDDEYEIYNFTTQNGHIAFDPKLDSSSLPEITNQSETFCDRCAWHGQLKITDS